MSNKQQNPEQLSFDFEEIEYEPCLVCIKEVIDVLHKEGVDNTVILAVKELTM